MPLNPGCIVCRARCSADILIDDSFRFPIPRGVTWIPGKRVYFPVSGLRFAVRRGQFVFSEHPLRLYKGRMLSVRVRRMKPKFDFRTVAM